MPVIKLNPPYKHLVQKPSFCGPACVQMLLFRQGKWFDQEEIAMALDTGVRPERKQRYILKHKVVSRNVSLRLGVTLENMEKLLNKFFKKNKLKLRSEVFKLSKINNLKDLIAKNLRAGNDIIIDFWLRQEKPKRNVGHYVLVSGIDTDKNTITICDSDPGVRSYWEISIADMMHLMDKNWDGNERGIVIIK